MIDEFIEYLSSEKHYALLTQKAYRRDLDVFQEFLNTEFDSDLIQDVNYSQIRSWIVILVDKGLSTRSVNRKVSALNSYFKFLIKVDYILTNPLAKHKALKTSKKIQIPFSEQEVTNVLTLVDGDTPFEALRNQLVLELFYTTGIRRAELINIELNNIDLQSKTLKVLGKRNKERIIPLLDIVVETCVKYLPLRAQVENIANNQRLFVTNKGGDFYETLVYRLINSYFSKVSTKEKKSPHMLRHAFATHLLNQGANLNAVKELLGHSSLASTQVYTHNNISELTKVYKNAHPRSKK